MWCICCCSVSLSIFGVLGFYGLAQYLKLGSLYSKLCDIYVKKVSLVGVLE